MRQRVRTRVRKQVRELEARLRGIFLAAAAAGARGSCCKASMLAGVHSSLRIFNRYVTHERELKLEPRRNAAAEQPKCHLCSAGNGLSHREFAVAGWLLLQPMIWI